MPNFLLLCPPNPIPHALPFPDHAQAANPFGHWPSPITPAIAAAGSRRFGGLKAEAGAVYWTESRPEEGGRQTILQGRADGSVRDLLAAPFRPDRACTNMAAANSPSWARPFTSRMTATSRSMSSGRVKRQGASPMPPICGLPITASMANASA